MDADNITEHEEHYTSSESLRGKIERLEADATLPSEQKWQKLQALALFHIAYQLAVLNQR